MNAVLLLLAVSIAVGVRSAVSGRSIHPGLIFVFSCLCVLAFYSRRVVN